MRVSHPPADGGPLATIWVTGRLYARVMGDTWFQLGEPIRELHSTRSPMRACGCLRVEHGHHRLARIIARAFRLPPPGAATRTELSVVTLDDGERWQRAFGATRVDTHQSSNGLDLVERYGALEFRFRLHASAGRLVYRQREAAVRLFAFRLRLPGRLAPHIEASEEAVAPRRVKIAVSITIPRIGVLIAYDGIIDVAETVA